MALRYLEVRLPNGDRDEAHDLTEGHDVIDHSFVPASTEDDLHRFLLESDRVEALVDALRTHFGEDKRMLIMAVEATLPRMEPEPVAVPVTPPPEKAKATLRVSREELYEDVGERITLNPVFLALAAVSAVVACLGLARNDTIALIGAMVIAPLLGPNMGLALAATLGDLKLGKKALKSGLAGIGLSFLIAVSYGYFLGAPQTPALLERIAPNYGHLVLALMSGLAGGLAVTTGLPASLIGVMVAVALLPPLAAGGMLLGSGQTDKSIGAFILLGINLVAINLASVATFLVQGVRPAWKSEQGKARKAAIRAILAWTLLLAALATGIWWIQRGGP